MILRTDFYFTFLMAYYAEANHAVIRISSTLMIKNEKVVRLVIV